MRRRADRMMRAIREADPAASPQVTDWAETSEAALVAERIRAEGDRDVPVQQPMRRRPGRRLVIVIALLVVAASAVAASVALRSRAPEVTSLVACYPELDIDSGPVLLVARDDVSPVELCGRGWVNAFGTPRPARLISCVRPEGGLVVYPLPPGEDALGACGQVGSAPYSKEDAAG